MTIAAAAQVPSPASLASAKLAVKGGTPVSATPVPFMSTALAEADIQAATAVLRSGMLRQAARCAELEQRFAALSHAKHALTCANGTCALQLAYETFLKPGDEVLVPAWTYIATAAMLVARGCVPIFCDAREDTYQIDVADAARRITPRTKAIACTHLYGCPVDIDAVQSLAKAHNLVVIYDAAQAHLATYKGRGIGAFGDAVTYSFYATKNLATGEGGLVTTNSDQAANHMKLLRSHGETQKYLHEMVGYNYRMNDITAAIGCSRLDRLESQNQARRAAAARFGLMLNELPGLHAPMPTPGSEPVYHLYTVRMDLPAFTASRDEFVAALQAEGVPTAIHYPRSLTRQPAFRHVVKDHPHIADGLSAKVFCLPMHHDLTEAHYAAIAEAMRKVHAAFKR